MPRDKKTLYNENSIVTETPREFARRVPATYLGSAQKNTNLIKEIFANAVDEHVIGHGNKIIVSAFIEENKYIVQDFGQGFLVNSGIDQDGKTILQRSFDTMNTSGKSSEDGVYSGTSLGLNGIGAKLTNWLSKSLTVRTVRGGKYEEIEFKDGGIFKRRAVGKTKEPSGTTVIWHPDEKFFKENVPDVTYLNNYFTEISALCPDLEIVFNENVFINKDGLNGLIDARFKSKEIFNERFSIERSMEQEKINMVLTYTSDYSDNISAYVNYGHTESGVHINAIKSAFTKSVNNYASDKKLLKKNDKKFTISEISEGLTIITNIVTKTAKYDAQSKSRIDDIDDTLINAVLGADFLMWLNAHPEEASVIVDRALEARKAKEAAKAAKERVRGTKKVRKNAFLSMPTNLSDAYPKNKNDRSKCELYICEGLSAKGSITAVKDSTFQAAISIRGKIKNIQTDSVDKIYKNEEISAIIKALGLKARPNGTLEYNVKDLRYSKIIIASDNDVDGFHIRNLLLTMFDRLCPELIINNHVYIVESALFTAIFSDESYELFYTEADFNAWKKKNKKKYTLKRNKGLGALTQEAAYEQLTNPKTRGLFLVDASKNYTKFKHNVEIVQGKNVEIRRELLDKHYNDFNEE